MSQPSTTIRVKEAVELLKGVISYNRECGKRNRPATEYIVPFLIGDPGIGKTSAVNQASKEMEVGCETIVPVSMDPTDMMGLPTIKDGQTSWAAPELLFRIEPGSTVFIDELTKASPMLINVGSQLLEERRINRHKLDKMSTIVCAGNHISNRAGDQELPAHVSQRMNHWHLVNPIDDVLEHAASIGLATEVTGYLAWRRQTAIKFDPNARCNPTQRSWFKVAHHCHNDHMKGLPRNLMRAMVAGYIGEGPAADYMAFVKLRDEMPSPESIIADPKNAKVPDVSKPDVLWAIVSALTGHATLKSIGPIMTYLGRVKAAEFTVFAIKDITQRYPKLNSAPEVMDWKLKNRSLFTPVV